MSAMTSGVHGGLGCMCWVGMFVRRLDVQPQRVTNR